jgi:hypothetical protein
LTAQDLTAILKKSIPTPMNSKQQAEREIRQTEREIENLNNKLQKQKEALQNIDKPRYVYEAECGDEMYDGCILISRIASKDECWAILGAPPQKLLKIKMYLSAKLEEICGFFQLLR